ncbi:MAG: hypothetical protein GX222_02015 [Ruminococcaceae bacterium]|nr:hypothetical protein [Oscillospiraceae bacterium]
MSDKPILFFEIILSAVIVVLGLKDVKILFLQGPRHMTIVLGIMGMLLCTNSIGKFISSAPFHILSVLGYIVGGFALITFSAQLFNLKIPVIENPKTALVLLAAALVLKGFIARLRPLLTAAVKN